MGDIIRGSEWRRWDFHIHTPGTLKNDQFSGSDIEEKWDRYYQDISDYIGDGSDDSKNIIALGITDYLSVENYKRIVTEKRLPTSVQFVFPNVELRIGPIAKSAPINIHCIFDPGIVESLESRFFGQLEFSYGGSNYSATKSELIRLGESIDSSLDKDSAYKKGVEQFVLTDHNVLRMLFKKDPELREKTIIIVANGSGDGVSGIVRHEGYCEQSGSQLDATRSAIYQFSDAIFSTNQNDIDYFLGKKSDCEEEIVRKCGSLKPCICGCDAHKNEKIFDQTNDKFCWIKANPTFNGIRQILYEPYGRVRIQQLKPEKKQDYNVIDKVIIKDENFAPMPIYFSDNLTCIIGGKSTGKSLLIHNLARAIDPQQVQEKSDLSKTSVKSLADIEVVWRDGTRSCPKDDDGRKIVYIPQTYLNRLSDEKEESTEIDTIIENIVLFNPVSAEAYKERKQTLATYKPILDKQIYDLITSNQTKINITEKKKEFGTEKGIQDEINKLNEEKDKIVKKLNLEKTDIQKYDQAVNKIKEIDQQKKSFTMDCNFINGIDDVVTEKDLFENLMPQTKTDFEEAIHYVVQVAKRTWEDKKKELIKKLSEQIGDLELKKKENEQIEADLHDRMENNQAIMELSKLIQCEVEKLAELRKINQEHKSAVENFNKLLAEVIKSVTIYKEYHKKYAQVVNSNSTDAINDLEFSVEIPFRCEAFCENIKQIFDQRSLKRIMFDIDGFDSDCYNHENIELLVKSVLNRTATLKKGFTEETALRDILGDWYNIGYSVKMDSDTIQDMSPGKKALVLLKLLISLAESKCPILIDQPEDDLDNRSIFNDLIVFIKQKKIDRQIIVATHNANIVLGGDAEEVIVANQEGKNSPNKQYKFEYRFGAIENDIPIHGEDGNIDKGILNSKGIQQHICDILEGGERAFDLRKNKYHFGHI